MIFFYLLLAFIVFAIIFLRTPAGKGWLGELIVKFIVGKTVCDDTKEQYVVNNLMIENENGQTSQIDHIVINKNGVFVIETKNYSGRIYGNDNQLQWTQVLNYGRVKNKFYNPVKQNATHIYRIKQKVDINVPFYSVIVFVKNNIDYIESDKVFKCSNFKKYLNQDRGVDLSSQTMKSIYSTLTNIKQTNTVTNAEHINNINTMRQNIDNDICPRCGGALIIRDGKHGLFRGCENYPKCKFVKKNM